MTKPDPWDTPRIRELFIYDGGEAAYHDPINGEREQRRVYGEVFDAWLAAHDAEVRAEAWDEGFYAGVNHDLGDYEVAPDPIVNPYRAQNHTDGSGA